MRRIDILFEIKHTVNGKTPEQRLAVRREKSGPIVADLEIWMREQRALLSSSNDTAKAINYLLNRWAAFTRFWTTAASASRTTLPNERYAVWPSEDEIGHSPVQTLVAIGPPPSIP